MSAARRRPCEDDDDGDDDDRAVCRRAQLDAARRPRDRTRAAGRGSAGCGAASPKRRRADDDDGGAAFGADDGRGTTSQTDTSAARDDADKSDDGCVSHWGVRLEDEDDAGESSASRRRVAAARRASAVYCGGPLLAAVQSVGLFADSKTFVDMPLLDDPEAVARAFEALSPQSQRDPETLRAFVARYFGAPSAELERWTPDDWTPRPRKLVRAVDPVRRAWALDLNERWKDLGRRVVGAAADASEEESSRQRDGDHEYRGGVRGEDGLGDGRLRRRGPDDEETRAAAAATTTSSSYRATSLLAPSWPFVAPGGRFREPYYWDSYWIVLGLLACGMLRTARGVVEGLLGYVRDFGFVPNGGRVYYLNRSQPPLLSEMLAEWLRAALDDDDDDDDDDSEAPAASETTRAASTPWTNREKGISAAEVLDVARRALPLLVREYEWWMRSPASTTTSTTTSSSGGHVVRVVVPPSDEAHVLNRYCAATRLPRPEAYAEDVATARHVPEARRAALFADLATAAESGWDFSSRWVRRRPRHGEHIDLAETKTTRVVPVDLNAIMLRFERTLAACHAFLGAAHVVERGGSSAERGPLDTPTLRRLWARARVVAGLDLGEEAQVDRRPQQRRGEQRAPAGGSDDDAEEAAWWARLATTPVTHTHS
eukprot:CAMPEP_0185695030 /NCGR_PEP_ID=MMETSP1164-20130828/4272_1 /TAXON_ID=1104430 /ORGANISM="Chrysoreinhardia sp, Strain CCMP2950" /LENGTH=656 /DNA_ID=CAMNT_0028361889 /DNA_START=78 /DNA_END=2045 /DNA_ORIENTATION=+